MLLEQGECSGLHTLEAARRQVFVVEERDEDSGRAGARRTNVCLSSDTARVARPRCGRDFVVPYEREQLDLLGAVFFANVEVLGLQVRDEAAVPVLHDDIDFDDVGGRPKRGRLRSLLARREWHDEQNQGQRGMKPVHRAALLSFKTRQVAYLAETSATIS